MRSRTAFVPLPRRGRRGTRRLWRWRPRDRSRCNWRTLRSAGSRRGGGSSCGLSELRRRRARRVGADPSVARMTRTQSAFSAADWSWVTMMTDCPRWSTASRQEVRTSLLAWESRLPVGSSATMTAGLGEEPWQSRLFGAGRLRAGGRWWRREPSPRTSTMVRAGGGRGASACEAEGSSMFARASRVGTRLKDWKTKPMRSRRSRVGVVVRALQAGDRTASMYTSPEVGRRVRRGRGASWICPSPRGP